MLEEHIIVFLSKLVAEALNYRFCPNPSRTMFKYYLNNLYQGIDAPDFKINNCKLSQCGLIKSF